MTNKLTVSSVTATGTDSGTFEAHLSDLVPGKSYVFQAFARVSGTGAYSSSEQVFYAGTPTVFKMPGGAQPAVNKDWLELASAKEGSQYVVSTTYAGERNYTVFYDTQMTTPLWTAYPLDSSHMGSLRRPSGWSYNPNIDEKYQVRVTDGSYSNSTYSRGHMCPNGSRNGNATMQAQTFYVTNQVPQIQNSFNSGIWSNLENAVQGIAKSHNEEIYVVTGAAFERHVQREKPNNLQLAQQTKALIHNKLAYGAKARLPTFSHNLHLVIHYISLTLKNIHKITTCRLFESIQFCDVPFFVTHRIICGPSAIPDNRCLTEWISSVKLRLLTDKLFILNNLSVKPHLFTDKLSILSQPYSVIRIIVASRTASHRKKLNFMQTHRS